MLSAVRFAAKGINQRLVVSFPQGHGMGCLFPVKCKELSKSKLLVA
jgi:hypothetical protein